jgi:cytochrome c
LNSSTNSARSDPARLAGRAATTRGWLLLVAACLAAWGCASGAPSTAVANGGQALFGIGRPATGDEIRRWDIDVSPDGAGLPPGAATARQGQRLYAERCAACHGATGREGPWDPLAGRQPGDAFIFGDDPAARRTVGSYWPYATTLFDYIRRAMPPAAPGSLDDVEVYALTAYILHVNELVALDAPVDAVTLPGVLMPARDRFVPDTRRGGAEVR